MRLIDRVGVFGVGVGLGHRLVQVLHQVPDRAIGVRAGSMMLAMSTWVPNRITTAGLASGRQITTGIRRVQAPPTP